MNQKFRLVLTKTLISERPTRQTPLMVAFILLIVVLTSVSYWNNFFGLADLLPAVPKKIWAGEYWRFFTAIFTHSDIRHLLSNTIGLVVLTHLLFGYFGAPIYFSLLLIGGAITNYLAVLSYSPDTSLVGFSGVIYLMYGFWLIQFMGIERRFTFGQRLMRSIGFALVILMPSTYEPEVSYRTHAIGFVVGFTWGIIYFLIKQNFFKLFEGYRVDIEEEEPV